MAKFEFNAHDWVPDETSEARRLAALPPPPETVCTMPWPKTGMLRQVADYFYYSGPKPYAEAALAAALVVGAGIAGRVFQIRGDALTQYILLAGATGVGKESGAGGIDKLVDAVSRYSDVYAPITNFFGAGYLPSGQGMFPLLADKPSMWQVSAEVAAMLQTINDPKKANGAEKYLKAVLLDLFHKGGKGRLLNPGAYSELSKQKMGDKGPKTIPSPNFCLLGDLTVEDYWKLFNSSIMSSGFMPRFLGIMNENAVRSPLNPRRNEDPPEELVRGIAQLVARVTKLAPNAEATTFVDMVVSPAATKRIEMFDAEVDAMINAEPGDSPIRHALNRAGIRVPRLAGVYAALDADHAADETPQVLERHVVWAEELVRIDMNRLTKHIRAGLIGEGETKYDGLIIDAVRDWIHKTPEERVTYGANGGVANFPHLVPTRFFQRRFNDNPDFGQHSRGGKEALARALEELAKGGVLEKVENFRLKKGEYTSGTPLSVRQAEYWVVTPSFPKK